MSETNYQRLFGTPERAAETLKKVIRDATMCYYTPCDECQIKDKLCADARSVVPYLREEADDD